jgi:hypothetical protein
VLGTKVCLVSVLGTKVVLPSLLPSLLPLLCGDALVYCIAVCGCNVTSAPLLLPCWQLLRRLLLLLLPVRLLLRRTGSSWGRRRDGV